MEYDASGNETGRILANPTYQKNGTNVDAITFDNQVATTSIPVSKKWEDANDQDGKRAKEVKVHLLADGKDTGKTVILNADNNWKASFNDVDAYQSGKKIQYTVSEDKVDGYTASISVNTKDGFVITNKHVVVDTTVKEKPTKPKSTQTGVPMNMRVYSIMAILPLIGIILLKRKYS